MKLKYKQKENRIFLFLFIITLVVMLLGYLQNKGIFSTITQCLTVPGYKENYFLNIESVLGLADVKPTYFNIIYHVLTFNPIQFDSTIIFSTVWFQIFIVLYGYIAGLILYRYWTTISSMELYRIKSKKKYLFSKSLSISNKTSLSVFLAYLVFLTFVYLICDKDGVTGAPGRSLFSDIIGNHLYQEYTYFYFILEGAVRFYLVPFVYSMFSCLAVLWNQTVKGIIGYPLGYFYGFALVGACLYMIAPESNMIQMLANYVNPTMIM